MTDVSCRECRFQTFRAVPVSQGDMQSMCGLHNVPSDYARMMWFRDRSNTIPSEENCGVSGKFWQARAA